MRPRNASVVYVFGKQITCLVKNGQPFTKTTHLILQKRKKTLTYDNVLLMMLSYTGFYIQASYWHAEFVFFVFNGLSR